jgi:hypothetical protein
METQHRLEGSRLLNFMPFVAMPERISVVRLGTALRFRPPGVTLAQAGTFIHNGDEIWSFTPLPSLMRAFGKMVEAPLCRSRARLEIEAGASGRKMVSWLLRKHFERYLARFSATGLVVEGVANGPRAYFQGAHGEPLTITYMTNGQIEDSRNVVVQRCGGRRPWFKNEGLGYRVVALGGVWGVAIEPFYIFTGPDAKKPLPYAAQIERSSRWNGRDAKTGNGHLAFWQDFLTLGSQLVDLRESEIDDLLLGRSLLDLPRQIAI